MAQQGRTRSERASCPQPPSTSDLKTPTISVRPPASQLLETPGALLTRSDLRALGLERRGIDSVFRTLPVVFLPGYSTGMVKASDYVALLEKQTFSKDRVRPRP